LIIVSYTISKKSYIIHSLNEILYATELVKNIKKEE